MEKPNRYVVRGLASIILLALLGLCPSPVYAAVAQPSSLELQNIQAYQNARLSGDQLYIITYFIDFTVLPDEDVNELFIFRLLDATDAEITSTTAYPYYNQGYGQGAVAFYLEPDEAPGWGSSLSVQIMGNPLIDWTGDPPVTATDSITWSTGTTEDMQELISARIIYLASELEQSWDVEMVTSTEGVTVLSDTGAAYFLRVVPYLREIAPLALGQYIFYPDYPDDIPGADEFSESLVDSLDGTVLDIRGPERSMGLPQGSLNALFYYGFVIAFFLLLSSKKKLKKGTLFLAWPFVIFGAFLGIPLVVTILGAFLALLSSVWVIYKGSPA